MAQDVVAKKPTYITDGTPAGSYILFNNLANALTSSGMFNDETYALSGAYTIMVIEDCFAVISSGHRTVQSAVQNCLISLNQYSGLSCYQNTVVSTFLSGAGKHNGIMTKTAGNDITYYVDGTDRGTANNATNWGIVCFGGEGTSGSQNEPANTKLLEVLVWDKALDAGEIASAVTYSQGKWGTP
jgi:hypothetical protein